MRRSIVMAGFVVAAMSGAAFAKDTPSQKFITKAIQGNMAEVEMGKLAQSQGASDGVKSFGAMLVKDHGDANTKAMAAATSLGVTPPSEPSAMQKKDRDKLSKMSGDKFDRAFAQHMVMDHKKDIAEYKKASKMKSADQASQYANDTLPTLQTHLDAAQKLVKGGKAGT